jgi:hypothetical protein
MAAEVITEWKKGFRQTNTAERNSSLVAYRRGLISENAV